MVRCDADADDDDDGFSIFGMTKTTMMVRANINGVV
jgi:hypothetical protein